MTHRIEIVNCSTFRGDRKLRVHIPMVLEDVLAPGERGTYDMPEDRPVTLEVERVKEPA